MPSKQNLKVQRQQSARSLLCPMKPLSDERLAKAHGRAVRPCPPPQPSFTLGPKKVLILRVDFPDLPGDPVGYDSELASPTGAIYTSDYVQFEADNKVV